MDDDKVILKNLPVQITVKIDLPTEDSMITIAIVNNKDKVVGLVHAWNSYIEMSDGND